MPIYAYRCSTCGFAKDVLQKMSDPVLVECPSCHASTFMKQLTAAGFQLKGSGWYVTDFRGDNKAKGKPEPAEAQAGASGDKGGEPGAKTDAAPAADAKPEGKTAAPAEAKAAAPAPAAPAASPPASK